MRIRFWILAPLVLTPLVLAPMSAPSAERTDLERQATSIVHSFRSDRVSDARRMLNLRELLEADTKAAEIWNRQLTSELESLGKQLDVLNSPTKLDKQIQRLREESRELRESEDLTEERLKTEGLAILRDLRTAFQRKLAKQATERAQRTRIGKQLERMASFLEKVQADSATKSVAISESFEQIKKLSATLTSDGEQRIAKVSAENGKLSQRFDRAEIEGIFHLNELRILLGFNPLLIDEKLCEAARGHSRDMVANDFFDHVSPVEGKTTFLDRARLAGTKANAENIYFGSAAGRSPIDAWLVSPSHHKNMFDADWTHQGLGRAEKHWTQMFRQ